MQTILYIFIGVLVVLFIVAIVIIATGSLRVHKAGRDTTTVTDPIPDRSERNPETRIDQHLPEHESPSTN